MNTQQYSAPLYYVLVESNGRMFLADGETLDHMGIVLEEIGKVHIPIKAWTKSYYVNVDADRTAKKDRYEPNPLLKYFDKPPFELECSRQTTYLGPLVISSLTPLSETLFLQIQQHIHLCLK